jgi:hypothetical protein
MSNLITTTPSNEAVTALRAEIVGDYRPFVEIAAALKCTVRTVYNLVARHPDIAVRKINNVAHAKPADFRRALLGEPGPQTPRRGRPRMATKFEPERAAHP